MNERDRIIEFKALFGRIFEDGHQLPRHRKGGQKAHRRWKQRRAGGQ